MGLRRQWSPEQIAGWLKRTYPGEPQHQVSHETIYRSLFVQARGVLKKELLEHLRAKRMAGHTGWLGRKKPTSNESSTCTLNSA